MANYKVGDIIRLTRKFAEVSQEELAFQAGIATETISRIESGKHRITASTYRKIMEILNLFSEQNYAICSGKDVGIIEEKKLLEEAESKYEFEKARYYLNELKENAGESIIDRQYILRAEILLQYYNRQIDAAALVRGLKKALNLTLSSCDYENYRNKKYPFSAQELLILMNLSGAYNTLDELKKSEDISNLILRHLEEGYVDSEDIDNFRMVVKRNLTVTYEKMGRYEEALGLLQEILQEAIALSYGLLVPILLYDISWNMRKLNDICGYERFSAEEIKLKKKQAYYIAAARGDEYIKKLAADSYKKIYGEEIET